MNLKIGSDKLRFKITVEELDLLKEGSVLRETLTIGRRAFSIVIDPIAVSDDLTVIFDDNAIRLLVSPAKIGELSGMGRSKEGIFGSQQDLQLSLQVDLRADPRPRKKG